MINRLNIVKKITLAIFIPLLFLSCGAKSLKLESNKLSKALESVTKNNHEAITLANDIQSFSTFVKKDYGLTPYSNFNNFLINIGVKKRGLCWQLALDLIGHLKQKSYHVDYYVAGANINSYFKEHNVAVLTCKGCKIEEGIIIDLWRFGGNLYFAKFNEDKDFKWKQRGAKR